MFVALSNVYIDSPLYRRFVLMCSLQLPFNLDSEFSVVNVIALSSIHRDDAYRTYLLYYDENNDNNAHGLRPNQ